MYESLEQCLEFILDCGSLEQCLEFIVSCRLRLIMAPKGISTSESHCVKLAVNFMCQLGWNMVPNIWLNIIPDFHKYFWMR